MISLQEERTISYHTVTLGELTRAGDALAEINEINEAGEQQTRYCLFPLVSLVNKSPSQLKHRPNHDQASVAAAGNHVLHASGLPKFTSHHP